MLSGLSEWGTLAAARERERDEALDIEKGVLHCHLNETPLRGGGMNLNGLTEMMIGGNLPEEDGQKIQMRTEKKQLIVGRRLIDGMKFVEIQDQVTIFAVDPCRSKEIGQWPREILSKRTKRFVTRERK